MVKLFDNVRVQNSFIVVTNHTNNDNIRIIQLGYNCGLKLAGQAVWKHGQVKLVNQYDDMSYNMV